MKFQNLFLIIIMSLIFNTHVLARHRKPSLIDTLKKAIEPALVQPPQDQEVCFSPDEPCDIKLIKFVEKAEKSIDVAIFDINLDQLVHTLLVKSKDKKIPVRIVVDKRQAKGNHSLVPTLIKGGASIKYGRQRGIMHNKFIIVDGKAVELGSFNFTNHASQANRENQLYLWSPAIVDRYIKEFEKIWNSGVVAQ